MTALSQVLKPRKSVFDKSQRETVLDLTDLAEDKLDAKAFFAENFITQGMRQLYEAVFRRLDGLEDDGVFKLTEAMGGGKTHNMIAVGLLAKHPEMRKEMEAIYKPKLKGAARVISFSGRDQPDYGIWGALAEQLNKEDVFKNFYSPLKAPGQSEWIKLLKDEPTVILLDELPPYFQQASTIDVGKGTLADVTTQALSNLLVALGKDELKNVALVLSDLSGSYQKGSNIIADVFADFERETRRTSKEFIPVQQNTDELYHILRKRLFEEDPDQKVVEDVAKEYATELKRARQMDLTHDSPDALQQGIRDSYPFHPGIKELYARFKANPGFMQTRGLIRLMRCVVARMWDKKHGWANQSLLVHAHDVDPNDADTLTQLNQINSSLTNAIANDIANEGQAAAEKYSAELGNDLPQRISRLLLMSSLSTVQGSPKGLRDGELVGMLAAPGVALETIKHPVLLELRERSWYLHSDSQGNLLYKNVQNVSAKVNGYKQNVSPELARKEIIKQLKELFEPKLKDCYQKLYVLPGVDEIDVKRDEVAMVIYQPNQQGGLHPDLQKLYDNQLFKNRLCFLTGDAQSMESIHEQVRGILAVRSTLVDFETEKVPKNDPQFQEANELLNQYELRFLSAITNIFTKLYYPTKVGLTEANLSLQFKANQLNGEEQVRQLLEEKKKFHADTTKDSFVKEAEAKLFGGQKKHPLAEMVKAAAVRTDWPWHHPKALDQLKAEQLRKEHWREDGNWIEKGPFEKPPTNVSVQLSDRDDKTGKARLRVKPLNGDTVHYQYGTEVNKDCDTVDLAKLFETEEMVVAFLCVDSKGESKTGEPVLWRNQITLKHKFEAQGDEYLCILEVAPPNAEIRYTTDGSDPFAQGGVYGAPFPVKPGAIVSCVGVKGDFRSEVKHWNAPAKAGKVTQVDPKKPATWKTTLKRDTTSAAFALADLLHKHKADSFRVEVGVIAGDHYTMLSTDHCTPQPGERLLDYLNFIQDRTGITGELSLTVKSLKFETGQHLLDVAKTLNVTPKPEDVDQ
ncbi:MAG: DUF499 domain-containing protein [Flavobacteriales bacterium]|nr:DUF499 domain-containing protein [Flavobacteriales bacterium]